MIIQLNRFPRTVSKRDIRSLFETYGRVKGIIKSPRTVYVNMPEKERAEIAIRNLNQMNWRGWNLKVRRLRSAHNAPICRTEHGVTRLF